MIIVVDVLQKARELQVMGRRKAEGAGSGEAGQDLRGGRNAFDSIGPAQDLVDTAQDRGSIRLPAGPENALQGFDLHDEIALAVLQAVPQGHGAVDPVAGALVFFCRGRRGRLGQEGTEGGGLEEGGLAGGIGARQKDRPVRRQAVWNRLCQQGVVEVLRCKGEGRAFLIRMTVNVSTAPLSEDRHGMIRQGLPPGDDADAGIDPADYSQKSIDPVLLSPELAQHAVELDQVHMEEDPDIFHDKAEGIGAPGGAPRQQGGSPAEGGELLQDLRDPVHLFGKGRAVFVLQLLRAGKQAQDIVKDLEVGRDPGFVPEIGDQVDRKDQDQGQDPDPRVQEHEGKGREGGCGRSVVPEIPSCLQPLCQVQIVIEGIAAGMAQIREDLLQAEPQLFVGSSREKGILVLSEGEVPGPHGRCAEQVIEIFLSGRAAGPVYGPVDLVHVQVIPGDVVDLEALPVTEIVPGNPRIALGCRLLEGRRPEASAQGGQELFARPHPLLHPQHQRDRSEGCQQPYEDKECPKVFHISSCDLLFLC